MFILLATAAIAMFAAEISETKYIYATEDFASHAAAVDRARKRVHDAAETVVTKGDSKKERLTQAKAALRDAMKRKEAYERSSHKPYYAILILALLFVRAVYGTRGVRLPVALPKFASAFAGTGGDARDLNASAAFLLAAQGFRAIWTILLGRESRSGLGAFSWEEYRNNHIKSVEAFEKSLQKVGVASR